MRQRRLITPLSHNVNPIIRNQLVHLWRDWVEKLQKMLSLMNRAQHPWTNSIIVRTEICDNGLLALTKNSIKWKADGWGGRWRTSDWATLPFKCSSEPVIISKGFHLLKTGYAVCILIVVYFDELLHSDTGNSIEKVGHVAFILTCYDLCIWPQNNLKTSRLSKFIHQTLW